MTQCAPAPGNASAGDPSAPPGIAPVRSALARIIAAQDDCAVLSDDAIDARIAELDDRDAALKRQAV